MLQDFLSQVCVELEMPPIQVVKQTAVFHFEGVDVEIRDLGPGFSFCSKICPCPEKRQEDLFLQLMRANYLGQLTGASRIGLSQDEKFLTLSLGLPYELSYGAFREALEDFVNFLLYWREEVEKFEAQEQLL
ncbi:MAG: type III secretion system chaperone [Verrucomicrobiota bacterium]|nr:type III secretion system chaperone [Verrucomicrobiota bacterium]